MTLRVGEHRPHTVLTFTYFHLRPDSLQSASLTDSDLVRLHSYKFAGSCVHLVAHSCAFVLRHGTANKLAFKSDREFPSTSSSRLGLGLQMCAGRFKPKDAMSF